jgi:hypothetical protein
MSKTQWPHTLHISLNQEKPYVPVSKPECLVWPITAIIQISDVLVLKSDISVFTGKFPMARFWGISIKAFPLPPLEGASSTNENTYP